MRHGPSGAFRAGHVPSSLEPPDPESRDDAKNTEGVEYENHHYDDYDRVQDALDGPIHRNVGVDQPQRYADDDQ